MLVNAAKMSRWRIKNMSDDEKMTPEKEDKAGKNAVPDTTGPDRRRQSMIRKS